jgi:hypothetical protein
MYCTWRFRVLTLVEVYDDEHGRDGGAPAKPGAFGLVDDRGAGI